MIELANWAKGLGFMYCEASTGVYTLIEKSYPASEKVTVIKLRLKPRITLTATVRVASFYEITPNVFSTRDWQAIPDQPSVLYPDFGYEIDVEFAAEAGDYIGICYGEGDLWRDSDEGTGFWYLAGIHIPCVNVTFNWQDNTYTAYGGLGEGIEGGAAVGAMGKVRGFDFRGGGFRPL